MSSPMKSMSKMWLRARRSAARLLEDRSGVAAIEFVLIVPMMLVMFFGTVEFSSGVQIDRKVTLMARTLANLTSQGLTASDNALNGFFSASNAIIYPYPPGPTKSTVSELYIDPATGNARVQWSQGAEPRGAGTPVVIPASLIAKDVNGKIIPKQYLIYSEINYVYQPTVGYVMAPAGVKLKDEAYTRPRQSDCVFYPAAPAPVPPATQPACPTQLTPPGP
jgi:Flp pilus assembly pilin Flp